MRRCGTNSLVLRCQLGSWRGGRADAAVDYHFVPALNGQPSGNAQWEEISPVLVPAISR